MERHDRPGNERIQQSKRNGPKVLSSLLKSMKNNKTTSKTVIQSKCTEFNSFTFIDAVKHLESLYEYHPFRGTK